MKAVYLFLLASLIGIEISIGVLLAPTIFYPEKFIGEGVLTHFQSGLLMTNIFIKFNYVLLGVSILSILVEIFSFKNKHYSFKINFSKFMLSLIILALSLLFVFYFSAYVLQAQNLGEEATQTQEFIKIHGASEVVMKIIMFSQLALFFLNFKKNDII
ncbi:DUF4149 domain-containing protein [Campylobacter insulaenigrae]|uniref:DUF4149 domain-containing protein n=1 Tax=Campylobacter insulaenigrae TaxID=260714 RepID=A0ABY3G748_9BACT|nr:DUF4149 domain-containing protein [Campylobacter insulaenigrae]MCR6570836.1 DUF4149 domain-containing protein [Campylobacter insulaenigrae]MCR6572506.1 DUF4149 domain-containing protein [Campylobacter insulaenigrae]MCR6575323.1 DUF4149 domain-containing protein [Campylobacter insulaenigrae]MCR6576877.1 DUF4149 domain-containing protein [Campylobacter insulaenigrae]MCR6581382.1 DUF4149 domain-containing protein [Campylobacter insulaenigrae]